MKSEYGALVDEYQQGKTKTRKRNTCPRATLSTKNPTQTGLGSKPGLYGEKSGSNPGCSLLNTTVCDLTSCSYNRLQHTPSQPRRPRCILQIRTTTDSSVRKLITILTANNYHVNKLR
jgi:hypothetical protein